MTNEDRVDDTHTEGQHGDADSDYEACQRARSRVVSLRAYGGASAASAFCGCTECGDPHLATPISEDVVTLSCWRCASIVHRRCGRTAWAALEGRREFACHACLFARCQAQGLQVPIYAQEVLQQAILGQQNAASRRRLSAYLSSPHVHQGRRRAASRRRDENGRHTCAGLRRRQTDPQNEENLNWDEDLVDATHGDSDYVDGSDEEEEVDFQELAREYTRAGALILYRDSSS